MYFISAEDERYVQRALLAEARRQPVAEELRGWNWQQPPLKPIYAQPLGVAEIAARYCPTGRDVYLRRVQGLRPPPSAAMREGRLLHQVVATAYQEAKRLVYQHGGGCLPHLERLVEQSLDEAPLAGLAAAEMDQLRWKMRALWAFETRRALEQVEGALALHPSLGADALALVALPVSVEVKLDGRYLGLSEQLRVDAVSFPRMLVFDLKFGPREEFHRLSTTGYALALESLFEVPVEIGCIVAARFVDGRVALERDFHLIDDELRQEFIQERDEKARLVELEADPGLPEVCPLACPFLPTCRPSAEASENGPQQATVAKPPTRRSRQAPETG